MKEIPDFLLTEKKEDYDKKKKLLSHKYNLVDLDGSLLKNKFDILKAFSNSLNFPDYFGNNWDALFDSLTDLSWLRNKNTVVLLRNFENVDLKLCEQLMSVLKDARDFWKKEKVTLDIYLFDEFNDKL